jgi:hypothetical protein
MGWVPESSIRCATEHSARDPVRDQVAGIDGTNRIVMAIGYRDDSHSHDEVLAFVARARVGTPSP